MTASVKATKHQLLSTSERFWLKVHKREPAECWPWLAGKDKRGYGRFRVNGSRCVWAHIYALEEKLGRAIGERAETLHECDNPGCCNPAHLREGTTADNMRDMFARGRARPGGRAVAGLTGGHNHGGSAWSRPITSAQVDALRWLIKRGGAGCFDRNGVLLAMGESAPVVRSTWNRLRDLELVQTYNPHNKGRGRLRVTDAGRKVAA